MLALATTATLLGAALAGCGAATTPNDAWSTIPEGPLSARRSAVAAWVGERFVVVGGWADPMCPPFADCVGPEGPPLSDAAALDPVTGRWETLAAAPIGVAAIATAVLDDVLYVLAAEHPDARPTMLAYAPREDTWTRLPAPPGPSWQLVAAGSVLVSISWSDEHEPATDAVFDPGAGTWTVLPDDPLGPSFDRAAVYTGGQLILTAKDLVPSPGSERPAVIRMAELSPDMTHWGTPHDTEIIGWNPVAVAGRVVFPGTGSADGGEVNNWGRPYPEGGIHDPADGSWEPLPVARMTGAPRLAATLPSVPVGDRLVAAGGLLHPVTGEWTALPDPPWGEVYEQAVAAAADTLFVWGGATLDGNLGEGYLLRP